MRIAVVGVGYVGLVSGACLADLGHSVTCADVDQQKIAGLQARRIPIFEPGLQSIVDRNAATGGLRFTTEVSSAVREAEVVFITVGTPSRRGDGHADLSYVYSVAETVARAITRFTVVVTKSTVPMGTGDEVERLILEANPAAQAVVVSNPEFLREGAAIKDFMHPDRIVIGTDDDRAKQVMRELYGPLILKEAPVVLVGRRTAELIKYAGNAFLAMKITFINEIADLCERTGADVQEVAHGIGLDSRIGRTFLNVGPGYGGSCFPKDTVALMKTAQDHGAPLELVEATVAANERRKRAMGRKVILACNGNVRGMIVGILGLTFKPNTDDLREAPAIAIIQTLQDAGALIQVFDPAGMETASQHLEGVSYCIDAYTAAADADCVVLVTEWTVFRSLDLVHLRVVMRTPRFVDLRNVYDPEEMAAAGFAYTSLGRLGRVQQKLHANTAGGLDDRFSILQSPPPLQ